MRAWGAFFLCLCVGVASATEVGERVPPFTFKDIRYLSRTLEETGPARVYALVFVTRESPAAETLLPDAAALDAAYHPLGVRFVLVDASSEGGVVETAAFALRHDLPLPALRDLDGSCARALGVARAPAVALVDAERVLRYRGGFGDELRAALDELLAGRSVSNPETPLEGPLLMPPRPPVADPQLSYCRDIAPLIQRHCLECHRKGGSAPFSLDGYRRVRRHGRMIAEVVAERRMPPWFAASADFANHRGLDPAERGRVLAWVAAGMPEGDPAQLPPSRSFPEGPWALGQPDLLLRTRTPIRVKADGFVPYQYAMLKHRFPADTWVSRIEIVGDHPEVLHHCNLFFLRPGRAFDTSQILAGKVPGSAPLDLPPGVAALIPAGSLLGLQIHYQPNGEALTDFISVGLSFPRAPVRQRFRAALIEARDFVIPPGARHHRVDASLTFEREVLAGGLFGHMHLRGKDFSFRATYPDGRAETLLVVPNYSFDWQMAYAFATPQRFPAGTRIDCVSHFDNSAFNAWNPDPTRAVRWGLQSTQEMVFHFVYYTNVGEDLDIAVDPATGAALPR